jgi:hypothetical protein
LARRNAACVPTTVFDAKYQDNFWRPITAIRNGDIAGNPATDRVATWHLTTRIVDTWLTQRRARPLFGRQPKLS